MTQVVKYIGDKLTFKIFIFILNSTITVQNFVKYWTLTVTRKPIRRNVHWHNALFENAHGTAMIQKQKF